MILESISLHNFRNFVDNKFKFAPSLTIIMGKNSVGKTNLLEGIFFVCNGKGLREEKQEELMNIEVASMHVEAEFSDKSSVTTFKIVLKQTENLEKIFF